MKGSEGSWGLEVTLMTCLWSWPLGSLAPPGLWMFRVAPLPELPIVLNFWLKALNAPGTLLELEEDRLKRSAALREPGSGCCTCCPLAGDNGEDASLSLMERVQLFSILT